MRTSRKWFPAYWCACGKYIRQRKDDPDILYRCPGGLMWDDAGKGCPYDTVINFKEDPPVIISKKPVTLA